MKTKMETIDENLKSVPLKQGLHFQDVRNTPARIYGLIEGEYARLPAALRPFASEKLLILQGNTSGGRVRFLTDSRRLGLRMIVTDSEGFPHMAYSGYAGIDCYLGEGPDPEYLGTRWPPLGERLLESEFELPGTLSLVTLYLPLYDGIKLLELGLEPDAALLAPPPYTRETPIVFYGSSITQGGCASRSSNTYCALVSRWLDSDFYCLGFSGNAKGEQWMAEYIAQLSMSCFVYDYDHNAPSPDYLRQT
ncbi:MAG: SGNH/GDSL hydrolase family protein, partial [Lachnospiraceae bacterium]|nr:SGNH/GDSL hydrolase family protein [Lachnospiraceae bacterium]